MNTPDFMPQLRLTFGRRLALFLAIVLLCSMIVVVLTGIISYFGGGMTAKVLRIAAVIQDILMFVIPPFVVALMVARRPDRFLLLARRPDVKTMTLALALIVVSAPAMNCIVAWNESLHLPASLGWLEQMMIDAEQSASAAMEVMMGGTSIVDLLMGVLIIGVLAGLSEELCFRGGLQQLLLTKPMNIHAAVWITAIVFSAFHFQFFGFVPRMLLGAYFGYLAVWSGSLWIPMAAHILNNTIVVVAEWCERAGYLQSDLDSLGTGGTAADVALVAVSIALTAAGLVALRRLTSRNLQNAGMYE